MTTTVPASHDSVELTPVPHRIVTTWPVGTFVENIAALPGGDFVVSIHSARQVQRISRDGHTQRLAETEVPPAGIVVADDGLFIVAGSPGEGPHRLLHVTLDGRVEERMRIPDTLFLNGFTPASAGRAYTVDSIRGTVIEIDLTLSTSRVVLAHELLTKCSSEPMLPGVNGIKLFDGALWMTNTDRALVLCAPLAPDGPTGEIIVVAEHLRGDDIALDAAGDLYVTNHIHNTLIRLGRDGRRIALAGPEQGMPGCTACVFGYGSGDETALYVTTTGGIVMPLDGVVQPAKLVRLDVGAAGRPIAPLSASAHA